MTDVRNWQRVPLDGDLIMLDGTRYSLGPVRMLLDLNDEDTFKERYREGLRHIANVLAMQWTRTRVDAGARTYYLREGDSITLAYDRATPAIRPLVRIITQSFWPHFGQPSKRVDVPMAQATAEMYQYAPRTVHTRYTDTGGRVAAQYALDELTTHIASRLQLLMHTFPPKCCDAYCEPSVRGPMCLVCDKRWVLPKIVRRSPRD